MRQIHEIETQDIQQKLQTTNREQQQCRIWEQCLHDYPENM